MVRSVQERLWIYHFVYRLGGEAEQALLDSERGKPMPRKTRYECRALMIPHEGADQGATTERSTE